MVDGGRRQQPAYRHAGSLATQIPQRRVETAVGVARDAAGSVPGGTRLHGQGDAIDVVDVHAGDNRRQAVTEGGRSRRLDDGAAHVAARNHLPESHPPVIGMDANDEHILRAVGDLFHLRQPQVQGFDALDFHESGLCS